MITRAFLALLTLFALAPAMSASIGSSLDDIRRLYGSEVAVSTYRPDLYPTSYDFERGCAKISVTILSGTTRKIDVFFGKRPTESIQVLLERYSGGSGWRQVSTDDPIFERQFPLFDPSRADLFASPGVVAAVQRDVGLGELVLWIQAESYPEMLSDYRKKQK